MKHIGADSVSVRTVKSTDIIIIAYLFILFSDYRFPVFIRAFRPQCSLNKRIIYRLESVLSWKNSSALRMQKLEI